MRSSFVRFFFGFCECNLCGWNFGLQTPQISRSFFCCAIRLGHFGSVILMFFGVGKCLVINFCGGLAGMPESCMGRAFSVHVNPCKRVTSTWI